MIRFYYFILVKISLSLILNSQFLIYTEPNLTLNHGNLKLILNSPQSVHFNPRIHFEQTQVLSGL